MTQVERDKKHDLLTVVLEDYFHVGALNGLISPHQWGRFEPRFESNTLKTLEPLKRYDVKATFFVLGWIAERCPELIAEVANRGHEIANYGFYHRNVRQMPREEFRDDARRSRDTLEIACSKRVIGYRIPHGLRSSSGLWMLDGRGGAGCVFGPSLVPRFRASAADARFRFAYH